jgi:hypothetical protein
MNMNIYIGLGYRSVLTTSSVVQCGSMLSLLIFESSSIELVREHISWVITNMIITCLSVFFT